MTDINYAQRSVILFDGVCNLCSSVAQFIIKRDKKKVFHFAALQSDFGQSLLQKNSLSGDIYNSVILFTGKKLYTKSTAALLVAKQLSGTWALLSVFIIVPLFIRDTIYDIVARNRYKWFGRKKECWIPSADLEARFLN